MVEYSSGGIKVAYLNNPRYLQWGGFAVSYDEKDPGAVPVIMAHERVAQSFHPAELAAILAHEDGHFNLGHHGLEHCIKQEIEADAYAAARLGARTVMRALKNTASIVRIYYPGYEDDESALVPRLEALQVLYEQQRAAERG